VTDAAGFGLWIRKPPVGPESDGTAHTHRGGLSQWVSASGLVSLVMSSEAKRSRDICPRMWLASHSQADPSAALGMTRGGAYGRDDRRTAGTWWCRSYASRRPRQSISASGPVFLCHVERSAAQPRHLPADVAHLPFVASSLGYARDDKRTACGRSNRRVKRSRP